MSNEQKLRDVIKRLLKAHRITLQAPPKTITEAENQLREIENAAKYAEEALATTEPAVNQQLTTAPVDEREAFEKWLGIKPCGAAHDFGWEAWQARAAMAQVGDINVVESFTNDTKDAERYRCIRRGQHVSVINGIGDILRAENLDAAIDAAMAKGVKG